MKLAVRDHKRDLEIVFLRENRKWTYPKIAEKYNITKVRARQLYERIKYERTMKDGNKQMGIGA